MKWHQIPWRNHAQIGSIRNTGCWNHYGLLASLMTCLEWMGAHVCLEHNTEALKIIPRTRIPRITTNQQRLVVLLDPHYVRMHLLYFLKRSDCAANYRGAVIRSPSCRRTYDKRFIRCYSRSTVTTFWFVLLIRVLCWRHWETECDIRWRLTFFDYKICAT